MRTRMFHRQQCARAAPSASVRPGYRAGVGPGGGRSGFGNVAVRRRRRSGAARRDGGNRDLNAGNFRRILDSTRRSSEEEGDRLDRLECMLFSKDGRIEKAADTSQVQSSQAKAVARLEGQGQFSKRLVSLDNLNKKEQDDVRDPIIDTILQDK